MNWKTFINVCHQKQVFKLLSIYIVSSWIIMQVGAIVWDPLGLPQILVTYLIILLLLGLPVHILYIWHYRLEKYRKVKQKDGVEIVEELSEIGSFRKKYFLSFGFISAFTLISIFLIINNKFISSDLNLQAGPLDIRQGDKIAVIQFGNNTGTEKYDIVGKIAADWITHGITQNKVAQVISPKIAEEYTEIVKASWNLNDSRQVVSKYLKPKKIIAGNYYLNDGKLIIQSSITDGDMNENLYAFKSIECDPDNPLDGIESLKQAILGYLITNNNKELSLEEKPPNYEAYKLVLNAKNNDLDNAGYLEALNQAIEIDPEYFEPKVLKVAFYYNLGQFSLADSIRKTIRPESKTNRRQLNLLEMYEALLEGKNGQVYERVKYEYEIAPFDLQSNASMMVVALQFVNRPDEVEDIFKEIRTDELVANNCSDCLNRIYVNALAYNETGQFNKTIGLLEPVVKSNDELFLKKPLITSWIRKGQFLKADKFISTSKNSDREELYLQAGKESLLSGFNDKAIEYFHKITKKNGQETSARDILANAWYYLKDFQKAEPYLEAMHQQNPDNMEIRAKLAATYFKNGEAEKGNKLVEEINSAPETYQFGAPDYALAQVKASQGDWANSLKYLQQAISSGYLFTSESFSNDPHFIPYFQYNGFKEILTYWQ